MTDLLDKPRRTFRKPSQAFVEDRLRNRREREASGRSLADLSFQEWFATEWIPVAGGAAHTTLTLDTTAPAGVTITLAGGASATATAAITATIGTSDGDTTGYQMKIYGDVSDTASPSEYRALEANAPWITFNASQAITLSSGDGTKTVRVKIRDDVWNASSEATDTITLDTTVPVPNITVAVSPTKISKVATKDTATFGWQVDTPFEEYKVKRVANSTDPHTSGTQIPTTAGSTNVSGSAGGYAATTTITTTIKGADLEAAGAEGANIVKVFVREASGTWSA